MVTDFVIECFVLVFTSLRAWLDENSFKSLLEYRDDEKFVNAS